MFVKVNGQTAIKYPYSIGELRRDNPNTSFPSRVPDETLASYGVFKVQEISAPAIDTKTQNLTQSAELVDGVWTQVWYPVNLPESQAAKNVRTYRDKLLSESDWTQVDDAPINKSTWATYRQALRDITSQAGFPHNIVWPTKPE
jgi:hypothetical protein